MYILNSLKETSKCLIYKSQKIKRKVTDIKHPFPITWFCIDKKTRATLTLCQMTYFGVFETELDLQTTISNLVKMAESSPKG